MPACATACTLPATFRREREAELRSLLASATRIYQSGEGIIGEFDGTDDVARVLLDVVLFERRCCAPLKYSLIFAPDHTKVSLKVEGASQYLAFLKTWLANEGQNVSPSSDKTAPGFRRVMGRLWATWARTRNARGCRCSAL